MEKITFVIMPEGEEKEFFVIADTRVNATNYLLVAEEDGDESEALILKDVSTDESTESQYIAIEDDDEFDAVAGVFKELLEDYDFE